MKIVRFHFCVAVLMSSVVLLPAAEGQVSPEVETLLATARRATEQFSDRRVAVANGYKRVGRDLPSMGEHWLSTRVLVDGKLDPARPALLTYLDIEGRAVLTGVVYAIPLAPGESVPADFGPSARWHEHNGDIDDEALLPEHRTMSTDPGGTRVAFLHAWLRVPSPEGIFSADNWALPFVRGRIAVPEKFTTGAARAVSLATGGKSYFLDLVGTAAAPLVEPLLDECGAVAANLLGSARSANRTLTDFELRQLDAKWASTMRNVEKAAGAHAARKLSGEIDPHQHHGS